jgi:hypothetical protein
MIKIEIVAEDKPGIFTNLTDSSEMPELGQRYTVEEDAGLIYLSGLGNSLTADNYLTLGLFLGNIPLNILACFLYDKLKNKFTPGDRLIINGREVALDAKEIEKILGIVHKNGKTN